MSESRKAEYMALLEKQKREMEAVRALRGNTNRTERLHRIQRVMFCKGTPTNLLPVHFNHRYNP